MQTDAIVASVVRNPAFSQTFRYSRNDVQLDVNTASEEERKNHYISILSSLMKNDPALFLERYGSLLDELELNQLNSIEALTNNYEANWHLKNYLSQYNKSKTKSNKNRRYQAMQKLMEDTDYFSIENMRLRAPDLYQNFVGQYIPHQANVTTNPNGGAPFAKDMKLYERLLYNNDLNEAQEREMTQNQEEEFDSDEESDEMDQNQDEEDEEDIWRYEDEFRELMQQKFLNGEDERHVDYVKLEKEAALEDMEDYQRDREDAYFDE